MDDAVLVQEFQRTADPTHFNALVERHRGSVFRLILSILGPGREGEAEELAQDVFEALVQHVAGTGHYRLFAGGGESDLLTVYFALKICVRAQLLQQLHQVDMGVQVNITGVGGQQLPD